MEKLVKVADYFAGQILIQNPDATTSIADLAQFTEFNPADAARYMTSPACVAIDAVEEEFYWETTDIRRDKYDGCSITFKDGSRISIW